MIRNDYEDEMWRILKNEAENEPARTIRVAEMSSNKVEGVDMNLAKEIVRSWDNRGLVLSFSNGARAALTQEGTKTEDPR